MDLGGAWVNILCYTVLYSGRSLGLAGGSEGKPRALGYQGESELVVGIGSLAPFLGGMLPAACLLTGLSAGVPHIQLHKKGAYNRRCYNKKSPNPTGVVCILNLNGSIYH